MWPGAKHLRLLFTSLAALWIHASLADDTPFNCHVVVDGVTFNLTKLAGEHVINRTRELPPTEMVDSLRFNLCADLEPIEDVAARDQCSSGTRTCLTAVNKKSGDGERVISVIPITTSNSSYSVRSSSKSLLISFGGAEYPHASNSTPVRQSMNMTLSCDTEVTESPKFVSYDGQRLFVEWTTSAACPESDGDGSKPGDSKPGGGGNENPTSGHVGSGIGWFFLMLLFAFAAYFAIGAYYNYSTYGARGLDLIPHRDFWQEVPYMLRDVVSHLCSNVGARRASRSGYIAV